jgi:thiamine biosynthesis lipoprotein
MGADARLLFCSADRAQVRRAVAAVLAEIERLECALSLFREDSEISRLNRDGLLAAPSADFRRALALALAVSDASGGLYDPTVQALWEAHVEWFAGAPQADLPPEPLVERARAAVDWRNVRIAPDAIGLGSRQRVTLNGLGQGYVTDRVADLLRQSGFRHVLVDLGEQRALGPRPGGEPWLVERAGARPIELREGALATSAGAGCVLGAAGAAHHLFDPRTGRSAGRWRRITVGHRSAAVADALSTALYVASPEELARLLPRFAGAQVWATDRAGAEWRWPRGALYQPT